MEVHRPKFIKGLIEEIFVIVISISLAVLAERGVEKWSHNKEGKEALDRLKTELEKDAMDLNYNYPLHNNAIIAEQVLTDWSKGKIELSNDSLAILASNSLSFSTFYANTSEIESLKSSSKLSYIEDKELVTKIVENYNRYEEYKLFTNQEFTIQQNLNAIYRKNTSYEMNSVFKEPFILFNGASVKSLRGNKEFENALQDKKEIDQIMLLTIKDDLKRVSDLIKEIKK